LTQDEGGGGHWLSISNSEPLLADDCLTVNKAIEEEIFRKSKSESKKVGVVVAMLFWKRAFHKKHRKKVGGIFGSVVKKKAHLEVFLEQRCTLFSDR
jgi:hypothetical protein